MCICLCTGNCDKSKECLRHMKVSNSHGHTYSHLEEMCVNNGYSEFIPYKKNVKKEENKEENKISYTLDNFIMDEIRKSMTN